MDEAVTPEVIKPQVVRYLLLHMVTYPEALEAKRPVCDMRGYLVAGPDRRGMNAPDPTRLWLTWQRDVQAAGRREGAVPQHVMDYYQATKQHTRPPKGGVVITHPGVRTSIGVTQDEIAHVDATCEELTSLINQEDALDFMGMDLGIEMSHSADLSLVAPTIITRKNPRPPHFATSYSGIKDFLNCPCKWAASKYWKTLPYIEGPEAAWGNRVHTAMENVINNKLIQDDIKVIKDNGYEKYLKAVFQARKNGALVAPEVELCLDKNLKPCGWRDWDTVWFRYKGDVHILKGLKFRYIDWKTGKRFSKRGDDQADIFQLEVAWAMVSVYFPLIEEFTGSLVFLQETDLAKVVVSATFTKADLPRIWDKILNYTARMEEAWATETFRMQKSGLCKNHCGNKECPHCG